MFKEKVAMMNHALNILKKLDNNTLLGKFVCIGIQQLIQLAEAMDESIHENCPFKQHFFHTLKELPLCDEGHWLELFEDLAFFFKQHYTLLPKSHIPPECQQIMTYFESCGEWTPQDGTLISTNYWAQANSN